MASTGIAVCEPVHVNLEVWTLGSESLLAGYENESYSAGSLGYFGRDGIYTTTKFVDQGRRLQTHNSTGFYAEYWMDYKYNDALINALNGSVTLFNNPKYYTATSTDYCPDGISGCLHSCSKTYACTLRERQPQAKTCLVVVHAEYYSDANYFQAVFANLQIPAYFCFIGTANVEQLALEAFANDWALVFYHWEPDVFHVRNPNKFSRVFLPNEDPSRVALSTGQFGEHGYGRPTDNQVDVDYPTTQLVKYAARILLHGPPDHGRMAWLLSRFSISELHIDDLLSDFATSTSLDEDVNRRYFNTACNWVRDNYNEWRFWLDPLPLCNFSDVNVFCSEITTLIDSREVISNLTFTWIVPHPDNSSLPYTCDGRIVRLPDSVLTRARCEWYAADITRYTSWLQAGSFKPPCDKHFYWCGIGSCGNSAFREITCAWIVPDPMDESRSLQCVDGDDLPVGAAIDCDYTPRSSQTYKFMGFVAAACGVMDLVAMGLVVRCRHIPIVAFSQPRLILVMLTGGLLMVSLVFVQGGPATDMLCCARSIILYLSMTLVWGTLSIKLWMTYQLSIREASSRGEALVELEKRSVQLLVLATCVTWLLLGVWFVVDRPHAQLVQVSVATVTYVGQVSQQLCVPGKANLEFLVMFWNLTFIVVVALLALVNRRVHFDFGESFWLFSSSLVVMVVTCLVLVMDVFVRLSAVAKFLFHSCLFLLDTFMIIGFLLVPKFMNLGVVPTTTGQSFSETTQHEWTRLDPKSSRESLVATTGRRRSTVEPDAAALNDLTNFFVDCHQNTNRRPTRLTVLGASTLEAKWQVDAANSAVNTVEARTAAQTPLPKCLQVTDFS